jgi:CRP-like cAMP-binding protein
MKLDPMKLRQVSVFQNATDDDLKLIAEHSILRSIEEGEFFFFQGDPAVYFYILISGRAKLMQTSPAGQQVNLRTISEWQMFGALGAIRENATYPATAQALEHCTALAVKSDYIQEMQERYRELATEKVERRIARVLLRLAAQMGTKKDSGIELTFTRQDLAEMSGTTLYTVSRVLSDWERQGLVEAGRERVLIRNPHGMVSIAEELNH